MASLIFCIENQKDIVVPVLGTVTLGRADGNDVLVDDPSISATHAEISESNGRHVLKDLGSRAGTFVNGKRIRSHTLSDGDQLSFGALRGRFVLDEAEKKPAPRPVQEKKERARPAAEDQEGRLATAVAAASETKQKLDAEVQLLTEERDRLKSVLGGDLAAHDAQIAPVRAKVLQLQNEERALVARLAALGKEAAAVETLASEKDRLQATVSALQAKHDELVAAVAIVERRQSDGAADLREHEEQLRQAAKESSEATAARDSIQRELKELAGRRAALDAEMERLAVRVPGAEARLSELSELAQAREDQVRAASQRLQQLEQRRKELDQHIESHGATEAKALQVRSELQQLTSEHAALQVMLVTRDEKLAELRTVESRVAALAPLRHEAEQQLAVAQGTFEKFLADAAVARSRSEAELAALEKQSALEREKLTRAGQQLRETLARNEDLQTQNRKLEGVEGKLREARTLLSQVVTRQSEVEAKIVAVEKDHQESLAKLGRLQGEVKVVEKNIESLRSQEAGVKQAVQDQQAVQAAEERRFEEMRKLVADTEAHAATHRARLDAAMEHRRSELAELESRSETLRTLHEDIDRRYEKLATLKPGSAEALALWQDTQEKKAALDPAAPSEGGIRARPQVRTVLVPRVRES